MVDDTAAVADVGGGQQAEADAAPSDAGRLSTVQEVSEETDISAGGYLHRNNDALQLVLAATGEDCTRLVEPEAEP
eukprot:11196335-Lingulodinium_polyedra.AAC.1